jgi:hypothetical protein
LPTNTTQPTAAVTVSPTIVPTATLTTPPQPTDVSPTHPPIAVCDCSGDIYDCEWAMQTMAQACFDYCMESGAGDVHGLDPDNNGKACQ